MKVKSYYSYNRLLQKFLILENSCLIPFSPTNTLFNQEEAQPPVTHSILWTLNHLYLINIWSWSGRAVILVLWKPVKQIVTSNFHFSRFGNWFLWSTKIRASTTKLAEHLVQHVKLSISTSELAVWNSGIFGKDPLPPSIFVFWIVALCYFIAQTLLLVKKSSRNCEICTYRLRIISEEYFSRYKNAFEINLISKMSRLLCAR